MMQRGRSSRGQLVEGEVTISIEETTDERIANRLNILDELLNTEKAYLDDLQVIVNKYLATIRQQSVTPPDITQKIFSNIESILALHTNLYSELEEKINDIRFASSIEFCISEIFTSRATTMYNYVTYSTNYKLAIQEVLQQTEKNQNFSQLLETQQKQDPHNLRLTDYLIKPIQRLCKYPLLFRELLNNTPEDHKDRQFMQETMFCLEKITNHVNEYHHIAESQEQISTLAATITGLDFQLVTNGRTLTKDGMISVSVNKEKFKSRRLIVFCDLILLVKLKSKKTYQYVSSVDSNQLLFNPTPTRDSPMKTIKKRSFGSNSPGSHLPENLELCFEIINVSSKDKYKFQCTSAADKAQWIEAIGKCNSANTFGLEAQLKSEKEARRTLQAKNVELLKKIRKLEKILDEEESLRRSMQEKLKDKNS